MSKQSPSIAKVIATLSAELRKHADPKRAEVSQRFFKEDENVVFLGLDTATLRTLVKEQTRPLPETWTLDQAVACCDRLLRAEEHELRAAGLLVLAAFKKAFTTDLVAPATRWLNTSLDNWALVDGFCTEVLAPLLDRHHQVEETLKVWSKDPCLWVRRAAIVTLVADARHGTRLDLAYRLAREHFTDREDLMHKAVGWLLREAGKTDMERLRQYLLKYGPDIPRTALRYAIERFPATERAAILRDTRV